MQKKLKAMYYYFSKGEKLLWCISVLLIIVSFIIFDRGNYLVLAASLIGVTSLIYDAKAIQQGRYLW